MRFPFALLLALWPISVHSINPGTSWRSEKAYFAFNEYGTPLSWMQEVYGDDDSISATIVPSTLTNVTSIFSSISSFAALLSNASVIAWGSQDTGGTAPAGLDNVKTIRSTDYAFAALKQDGSVIAWGDIDRGGSAPAGLSGVKDIFCSRGAFAAVKLDGTVVAWGGSHYGGNLSVQLTNVDKIYSADAFFTAVQRDGRIEPENVWSGVILMMPFTETLLNVTDVYCGSNQCLAFVRNADDGTVHARSWGRDDIALDIPDPWEGEVYRVFATYDAFAVLDQNGKVTMINFDKPEPEALQDIVAIYTTWDSFVTLSSTGIAYYWGYGPSQTITNVRTVAATTNDAFLFLMDDTSPGRNLKVLGDIVSGGILPTYDFVDIVDVAATSETFTVLQGDGLAVIWGNGQNSYDLIHMGEYTKRIYGYKENTLSLCAVNDPDNYDCKAILYDYTCLAGTSYVAEAVPGTCFECGPGSYSSRPNATLCSPCPFGKFMPYRGATACIECKSGSYSAANRQSCIGCPSGKYNWIDGPVQECLDCPLGKFRNADKGADCAPCSAGRYAAEVGQVSCALCALGKYGQIEMAKNETEGCHSCLATTYSNVAGSHMCGDCPPGSQCPYPGMSHADVCSPGRYSLMKASLSCIDCSAGRYQSRYGEAICEDCSSGKYGSVNGSINENDCQSCPKGTYSGARGSSACKSCSRSSYANVVGLSACIACSGTGMVSNSARTGCEIDAALAGPSLLETFYKKGLALGGSFFVTVVFVSIIYVLQWRKRVYLLEPRECNIGKAQLGMLKSLNEFLSCFSSGYSFGSDFFVIMGFSVTAPALAIIMIFFRLLHTLIAAIFITATFGPKRFRFLLDEFGVTKRVATLNVRIEDEFSRENEVFIGAAMLTCLCDCSLLIFLPWRESEMFKHTRGYPILSMLRWCEVIKVVQSIASAVCQLVFVMAIAHTEKVMMNSASSKAMIGMNIILSISKAIYGIITLCIKDGLYRKTERMDRTVKGVGGAEEREIEEGVQNVEGDSSGGDHGDFDSRSVELVENPLHASISDGVRRSSRAITHSISLGSEITEETRRGAVDEEMYAALKKRNIELEAEVRCLKAALAPFTEV